MSKKKLKKRKIVPMFSTIEGNKYVLMIATREIKAGQVLTEKDMKPITIIE